MGLSIGELFTTNSAHYVYAEVSVHVQVSQTTGLVVSVSPYQPLTPSACFLARAGVLVLAIRILLPEAVVLDGMDIARHLDELDWQARLLLVGVEGHGRVLARAGRP